MMRTAILILENLCTIYVLMNGCVYSWNDWLRCVALMTLMLLDVLEPSLLACRPQRVVETVSCPSETAESITPW